MKKVLLSLVIVLALFTSCARPKTIDGLTYRPYGLFNAESVANDSIYYEASPGSVICGIIFCETIIAPVYIFGWRTMEPVGKINPKLKGVIQK